MRRTRKRPSQFETLKKFEYASAHMGKCFEMISKAFGNIIENKEQPAEDMEIIEKLERSAKYFKKVEKVTQFSVIPKYFLYVRRKLETYRNLSFDEDAFMKMCDEEWEKLTEKEKNEVIDYNNYLNETRKRKRGYGVL